MANLDRWAQPKAGHRPPRGPGGQKSAPRQKQQKTKQIENPWGERSPFSQVATGTVGGAAPQPQMGQSMQQAVNAPFIMTPGATQYFGPNVGVALSGGGKWAGGPLAAPPNHYGYAKLTAPTKEWTRRIMGAFPMLTFSSGWRSRATNARIGGHPNSGHMRGVKIDLSGNAADLARAGAWARSMGAKVLIHGKKDMGHARDHLDISWEGVRL